MSDFDDNPFSFNYSGTDISKKIKIIFHIDFDYFFAQCEEIREPSIKNSPVVVCVYSGRHQDSGVVSASNYHARKYDVKSSMPIKFAKNKLELVKSYFFPLDIAYYKSISEKIMNIISSFSDIIEIRGLDECYLDVTSLLENNFDKSLVLAEKIKKTVNDQTGISCSIGISFNKILAKIASDYNKPNGFFLIDYKNYKKLAYPFTIDKVPGIGPKTKDKLNEMKITNIEQLVNTDLDSLIKICGKKIAYKLHNLCNPDFCESVDTKYTQKQIMKIITIKKDKVNNIDLINIIKKISLIVNSIALEKNLIYRNISVIMILENLFNITKSKNMKVYSNDQDQLILQSTHLLKEVLKNTKIENIRRIGIRISNLKQNTEQSAINQYFE